MAVTSAEITISQAGDVLGYSEEYVSALLDRGDLACHRVDADRLIFLDDLMVFKAERDRMRHEAIEQLALDDFNAGIYDLVYIPEGGRDE